MERHENSINSSYMSSDFLTEQMHCQWLINIFLYLFFKFYFILLYNTVLVLQYINMNPPWVYKCSQPWTLTIHLGHLSAPAPSILYPASNLDWQFISYMILSMFQWHSPKSSHPLSLPQSPKDCSIHLCLFCCLAYRVIVTIFLNSVYMHSVQFSRSCLTLCDPMNCSTPGLPVHHQLCISILYWCFSFWLSSLCIIGSSFIHFIRTDSNAFF